MTTFLTISDYFNQTGADLNNRRLKRIAPSNATAHADNFTHLLKGAPSHQKQMVVPPKRLDLSDYRKQAIRAKPTVSYDRAMGHQLKQKTAPDTHLVHRTADPSKPFPLLTGDAGFEMKTDT